jgi:hypothetical protein
MAVATAVVAPAVMKLRLSTMASLSIPRYFEGTRSSNTDGEWIDTSPASIFPAARFDAHRASIDPDSMFDQNTNVAQPRDVVESSATKGKHER